MYTYQCLAPDIVAAERCEKLEKESLRLVEAVHPYFRGRNLYLSVTSAFSAIFFRDTYKSECVQARDRPLRYLTTQVSVHRLSII